MKIPYIIIDDLLPQQASNELEYFMLNDIPWSYLYDITNDKDYGRGTPAFVHSFVKENGTITPFINLLNPIVNYGLEHISFTLHKIYKARSFLQLPLNDTFKKSDVDSLHVDSPFSHLVFLYYVIDSDGDTILVNHKRTDVTEYLLESENFETLARIKPKKNRLVIFDGDYYHTAEQPKDGVRCVINMNLLGEFNE